MGRTDAADGSQPACLKCGRVAACDQCAASLAEARQRAAARNARYESAMAAANLSVHVRQARYGSGSADAPEVRKRVRDRWGHGWGVRPKRALSESETAEYVVAGGRLVNRLTGELAHSDG
jgi:hypothetical protein